MLHLPNDYMWILYPEPGCQHAPVGAPEGHHRAVPGSRARRLKEGQELGEVGQRLLRTQIARCARVLHEKKAEIEYASTQQR